jgi:hypothetical protein
MLNHLINEKIIFIALAVIILGGGYAGAYYFYEKNTQAQDNSQTSTPAETAKLIGEVGKILELPTDEIPTIAIVMDKDKVKGQPFFKNAENGDKLLAYAKNQKAILYRPSTHKIIEVAPIYLDDAKNSASLNQIP